MSEKKGLFGFLKGWGATTTEEDEQQHDHASSQNGQRQRRDNSKYQVTEEMETFCVEKLEEILHLSGFSGKVKSVHRNGNRLTMDVFDTGDDIGRIIGKSGMTLDALQTLLRFFVIRKFETPIRVSIDAEDYKGRRVAQVKEKAEKAALEVVETGDRITLDPMNSSERRTVHMMFENHDEVTTISEGSGRHRRIILVRRDDA